MRRQLLSPRSASRQSPVVKGLGVAVLGAMILGLAPAPAKASWGPLHLWPPRVVAPTPPDQSWLRDAPEKPGSRSKGKVAVFVFKGDDPYQPVRAAVVRVLRRRGLNVSVTLRPADSASQYRDMSIALNLGVFVEGELSGEGARQTAKVRLRSGVTGQHITSATFSGPTKKIVADLTRTLWNRVGPTVMRSCTGASRPRKREHEPMRIEAGTPEDSTPTDPQGT